MLTMDEQKTADAPKTGVQNTNLDDVLLGKRVKIARKEKRITQEELAGLCNCIERGVMMSKQVLK